MPSAPPRACRCGGSIREGVCDRCGPRKRAPHKQTTTQRGLGWDWQKLVEARKANPDTTLCADCLEQGLIRVATQRHHMKKRATHPELRLDPDNIRDLCDGCHNVRTARGE